MQRDDIKQYLDRSPPDVRGYVEYVERQLETAVGEIDRLRGVVERHVKGAANMVVENLIVDPVTIRDVNGLRTSITVRPMEHTFYLAERLGTWSQDHREAFHRQVVKGFSEKSAEIIARSIWSAREADT